MVALDIDFDVFKALTARRESEEMSYNHVLRDLLDLDEPEKVERSSHSGYTWKGVTLPEGTELKSEFQGVQHTARIENGKWVQDGKTHGSPSAAAFEITHYGVNGWKFWSVKRPGDPTWQSLDRLRS